MSLIVEQYSISSDTSALLECTDDDENNYKTIHSEKKHGPSLQLVNVSPISGIARESSLKTDNVDTGNATISEEVFNLIKNIVGSVSTES